MTPPLRRRADGTYEKIDWDTAIREIAARLRAIVTKHGGDKVLTWCASNLIARTDVNNNMAPDKKRSPEKIDDMAALYMAVGVALSEVEQGDLNGFLSNPVIA